MSELIDREATVEQICKIGEMVGGHDRDVVISIALFVQDDKTAFPTVERPHGEWEALGFQQGYAFCRCSNCHKTMRLYRDSKNEFCCIADIRKKVVSCMYCGADMREGDEK